MSFAFYLLMSIMIFLFLCACTNPWIWLMHLSSGEEENAELAAKNDDLSSHATESVEAS
jgi:hypothetical protein